MQCRHSPRLLHGIIFLLCITFCNGVALRLNKAALDDDSSLPALSGINATSKRRRSAGLALLQDNDSKLQALSGVKATPQRRSAGVALLQVGAWVAQGLPPGAAGAEGAVEAVLGVAGGRDRNATTAADVLLLKENARGDLDAFMMALLLDSCAVLFIFVLFWPLRTTFPFVYSGNAEKAALDASGSPRSQCKSSAASAEADSTFPSKPSMDFLGWIRASLSISVDDIERNVGLDSAMLVEFSHLGMKICAVLGVPMCLVMCPAHYWLGPGQDGAWVDHLSQTGMANISAEHGWMLWLHACLVWLVTIAVEYLIWSAKESFLERRFRWLKAMPAPRSTSILVLNIPKKYCSDSELKAFFSRMFPPEVVLEAYVVRKTDTLLYWTNYWRTMEKAQQEAQFCFDKQGRRQRHHVFGMGEVDTIEYYEECKVEAMENIRSERRRLKEAATSPPDGPDLSVYEANAFVTFTSRREADIALQMQYTADARYMVSSIPPEPSDVRWADLRADPTSKRYKERVGYLYVLGLYISFMPICIAVSSLTNIDALRSNSPAVDHMMTTFPFLSSIVKSIGGSLALSLFMSFLPTLLVLIFDNFFMLKADAWVQRRLQDWYFWFMMIFILLVTTIGSSLVLAFKEVIERPFLIFGMLADSMPQTTHFYMSFMTLEWVIHSMNLTRYINLTKYIVLRSVCDEGRARELSEPEDQDYYGMGSRSARWTLNLIIALVFSSLSPLILPLTFVNFLLCRVIYGYLIVFTEVRKPDLGGGFFVKQLHHLQMGLFVYLILMIGVLYRRGANKGPMFVAIGAFAYALYIFRRLLLILQWERLPFEEVVEDPTFRKRLTTCGSYVQPELLDPPDEEAEKAM